MIYLEIVSIEGEIFSGAVHRVILVGAMGELEIRPGHCALLTRLMPGPVRFFCVEGEEEIAYVSGGILEVQPSVVTVLADTVIRSKDFNEAETLRAKEESERFLSDNRTPEEYEKIRLDLLHLSGILRAINQIKSKKI